MTKEDFQHKNIILVEDDSISRLRTLRVLKQTGNPKVISAENGLDATQLIKERQHFVDCVISDFNMPLMHGLKLLKYIRCGKNGIPRNIPVIMLSNYAEPVLTKIAVDLDVNHFTLKPLSKINLLSRLEFIFSMDKDDETWLKPVDEYMAVDADSEILDILDKNARNQIFTDDIRFDKDTSKNHFPVESLLPGHKLTRRVYGPKGELYFEVNTVLTLFIINILNDLVDTKLANNKFYVE